MKKLLLILLLTVSTYANNSKIPEKICSKHFDKVIEHGWSDDNATLNVFIIKSGSRAIPKILGNLKTPLIYKYYPKIPDFLINRHKYKQLFAYVKYLEHKNRMDESDKIYVDALDGLNNIESEQIISLIFRIVLEKILIKSIKESQERYGLSKELKDKLKQALLTNNEFLLEVVASENKIYNSYMEKYPQLIKMNEEMKTHFITAIKNDSLDEYNEYSAKKKEEYLSFSNIIKYGYTKGKVKLYTLLGLEPNKRFIDEFRIITSMYEPRTYIGKTIKEYREQVADNKVFLESLEIKNEQ